MPLSGVLWHPLTAPLTLLLQGGGFLADLLGAHVQGPLAAPSGQQCSDGGRLGGHAMPSRAWLTASATIECPGFPIRVKLTPDGKTALVSCPNAGEVAVIDAKTRAIRQRVSIPKREGGPPTSMPIGILVHPDASEIYVACAALDEVVARLNSLVSRFLEFTLVPLPAIPFDSAVADAAAEGTPVVLSRPDSPASRAIRQAERRLDVVARDDEQLIEGRFFSRRGIGRRADKK